MWSGEEDEYEGTRTALITQMCADGVVLKCITLDFWCSRLDLREEWLVDSHDFGQWTSTSTSIISTSQIMVLATFWVV